MFSPVEIIFLQLNLCVCRLSVEWRADVEALQADEQSAFNRKASKLSLHLTEPTLITKTERLYADGNNSDIDVMRIDNDYLFTNEKSICCKTFLHLIIFCRVTIVTL